MEKPDPIYLERRAEANREGGFTPTQAWNFKLLVSVYKGNLNVFMDEDHYQEAFLTGKHLVVRDNPRRDTAWPSDWYTEIPRERVGKLKGFHHYTHTLIYREGWAVSGQAWGMFYLMMDLAACAIQHDLTPEQKLEFRKDIRFWEEELDQPDPRMERVPGLFLQAVNTPPWFRRKELWMD